jgi:hypothetical protein
LGLCKDSSALPGNSGAAIHWCIGLIRAAQDDKPKILLKYILEDLRSAIDEFSKLESSWNEHAQSD